MGLNGRTCLVLGAGFLGTNLARRILACDGKTRIFSRSCHFPDALADADQHIGAITETDRLRELCQDVDIVFHLLGASTPASANSSPAAELTDVVAPTLAFIETIAKLGKPIVFISSGGTIYGVPNAVPIPESAANWPQTAYGIGKLVVERYLELYRLLHGLDYRILRLANPYGPYQLAHRGQGAIAAFIAQALKGEAISIWGDGSVVRDYLFVEDAVAAMLAAAATTNETRLYNIGSGRGVSLRDIVREIEGVLGQPLTVDYQAGRAVDVPVNVLDVALARSQLNWSPSVPLTEGLRQTVSWMEDHLAAE